MIRYQECLDNIRWLMLLFAVGEETDPFTKAERENIAVEVLKTRYGTAYQRLLSNIAADANTIIRHICFSNLPFRVGDEDEKSAFFTRAQVIVNEEHEKGVFQEIGRKVFREYDLDGAISLAFNKVGERIWKESYFPYWQKHCFRRDDGTIFNDIIGAVWDADRFGWMRDGNAVSYFPPEMT
ncbi:MAG: hypothetical protein LUE86_13240 [Clostridiales bacterium]|nr:hypothetical protein [Clostridiales bacterium]